MAYAAAITASTQHDPTVGRIYTFEIAETEAAAASEFELVGVPQMGTITLYQATLTSGTGTTIQPRIGKATGWSDSTQNAVAGQDAAAAHIHDVTRVEYTLAKGASSLFVRSTVDADTDNAISTIVTIVKGHHR